MGIAALVLGIISLILGFVPFCNIFALIPAIIGLILGIIDLVKKKKASEKFGISLAGLICSAIAIVIIIFYCVLLGFIVAVGAKEVEKTDWNEVNEMFNETKKSWNIEINEF